MPVTGRLLQKLHETLGDEVTDDLFVWWDEAATVNRAAIREIADLYFERFEARLDKGLTEVRADLRGEFNSELTQIRVQMANQRADLNKWMLVFWVGTVVPLAGLMVAMLLKL